MRKTYVATVTTEVVFTADTDAGDILSEVARDAVREDQRCGSATPQDIEVEPIGSIPIDWDKDCLVFGTHQGDLTLKQALSPDMAPCYHRKLQMLKEAREKFKSNPISPSQSN